MIMSKEVLLEDLFEGIEDDEVPQEPVSAGHEAVERGFSRLRKAKESDHVETPLVAAETSRKETSAENGEDGESDDQGDGYWDEEDEIEEHMKHGGVRVLDDEGDDESSEEEEEEDLALIAGDGTTRGDMNAETQRLLREVATKDRLGKGHKVQIKAFSGIVDKLKRKKDEVFGKAVQLRAPEAPKFDDIMSFAFESRDVTGQEAEEQDVEGEMDAAEVNDQVTKNSKPGTIQAFFHTPTKGKKKEPVEDIDGSDLEVVSSDDEEHDEKLIEVPRLTPTKPSPLAFDLRNDEDLEDFEDEAKRLFDDGADSESDSESDHSWAVHEEEGASGQGEVCNDVLSAEDSQSPQKDEDEEQSQHVEGLTTFSRMKDAMKVTHAQKKASEAKKSHFIDEEAELSDEEGRGIAVSDDEDDDHADVDQHGELKDLIDTDGKHHKNDATEELHIKWSRQQDAQQLKDILRGLENGFGRRRGGLLDDDGGEMTGRQRRLRHGDDDDDINLDMTWPNLFGIKNSTEGGDGEECEDEAMLMKAAQRKLVESQSVKAFGSYIPLDEDSQHVLELFSNSGSDPARPVDGPKRLRSRDKSGSGGSDGAGSSLSFLGRRSKVQRQQSTSNMGVHTNNKSFVFERKDSSQSRQAAEEPSTNNPQTICAAPIDFSDLRQLTSQAAENTSINPQKKSSTLLKALPRWNKPSNYKKKDSAHVIGAVCNQVAQKKP